MTFLKLGRWVVSRRGPVMVLGALFVVVAGLYAADVKSHLSLGGRDNPHAESMLADEELVKNLGGGAPNIVMLVRVDDPDPNRTVDDPSVAAIGQQVTDELAAQEHVVGVNSYWSLGNVPPLRATDKKSALVIGRIAGDVDEVNDRVKPIVDKMNRHVDGVTVSAGAEAPVFHEITHTVEEDLKRAELIAVPITAIVLLFVFRSVVSAALPLIGGVIAVIGTFLVLKLLTNVTLVSVFALNMSTALGLGLAIDYSLFVVSRYREERARGRFNHAAVVHTVATAGRSVVFSGLTVAISLGAMTVFPIPLMRSFAYAGVPVVFMAVIASVIVLPAVLAALGDRVDALPIGRSRKRTRTVQESGWYKVARFSMRRPLIVTIVMGAFLLVLATPFLRFNPGLPDDRVLPPGAESRTTGDATRANYPSREISAVSIVMPGVVVPDEQLDAYARSISRLDNVNRVDSRVGVFIKGERLLGPGKVTARFNHDDGTWLSAVPTVDSISAAGEDLVRAVRATPAPAERVLVGGLSARLVDNKASLLAQLPLALGLIAVVTFVLLFLSFGSILVPIKALILNTLSLTATFGAMVWIFQDGNLAETLNFTPTGLIDLNIPILAFCVAFGMSMDYEVFLLSRVKEEYDRTGDNEHSVAVGLARSGRIITAAAVTISIVFLAFGTSSISFLKLFGISLALAVIMDATVIRGFLVPALMRLAGKANWWAPRSMKAVADRAGVAETEIVEDVGPLRPILSLLQTDELAAMRREAGLGGEEPAVAPAGPRRIPVPDLTTTPIAALLAHAPEAPAARAPEPAATTEPAPSPAEPATTTAEREPVPSGSSPAPSGEAEAEIDLRDKPEDKSAERPKRRKVLVGR